MPEQEVPERFTIISSPDSSTYQKTAYIYIDRDDNLDSIYSKIESTGHPKTMYGFKFQAERGNYGENIRTGRYAIRPEDNMRYLYRRLSMGYQTPVNLTIPGVRTFDRLARTVARQLMIDSVEIARLLCRQQLLYSNGIYQKRPSLPLFIPQYIRSVLEHEC